jgi:hypothetical protein
LATAKKFRRRLTQICADNVKVKGKKVSHRLHGFLFMDGLLVLMAAGYKK